MCGRCVNLVRFQNEVVEALGLYMIPGRFYYASQGNSLDGLLWTMKPDEFVNLLYTLGIHVEFPKNEDEEYGMKLKYLTENENKFVIDVPKDIIDTVTCESVLLRGYRVYYVDINV